MKWKIDETQDLPLAVIEDTEDGHGVTEIGERTADNIKNAHLIAAAPELLEVLKRLRLVCSDDENDYPDSQLYRMVQVVCKTADQVIAMAEEVATLKDSLKLANFSVLALGTRFKYMEGKEGKTVWVKIGANSVARWDANQIATGWNGQSICSATENGEEIEVGIVE